MHKFEMSLLAPACSKLNSHDFKFFKKGENNWDGIIFFILLSEILFVGSQNGNVCYKFN